MPKGGYKIFNCNGVNFVNPSFTVGEHHTVPGLYSAIESSSGKPFILAGLSIGDVEVAPLWLNFRAIAEAYEAIAFLNNGLTPVRIHVSSRDIMQPAVLSSQAAGDAPVSDEELPSASM